MKNRINKNTVSKRVIAALLSGMMAASVLAGCGAASDAAGDTGADSGDVTVIRVGNPGVYNLQGFVDEDGNLTGYEPEILEAVDELLPQYEFEYEIIEFASLFPSLDASKIDIATSNLRRTEERDATYIHTYAAYGTSPYNILVAADNSDINGIEDLDGKTIGVSESSTQALILQDYIDNTGADIELYYTSDDISDLQSGRIDAIANPGRYALFVNTSYGEDVIKVVGEPIDSLVDADSVVADFNTYFWFRQGDEELQKAVSDALKTLYDNGTLKQLSEKWYQDDYVSTINHNAEDTYKSSLGQ